MLSHFHLYGELRFSGVMGWRNGPSGLREDDDAIGLSFYRPSNGAYGSSNFWIKMTVFAKMQKHTFAFFIILRYRQLKFLPLIFTHF